MNTLSIGISILNLTNKWAQQDLGKKGNSTGRLVANHQLYSL